MCATKLLAALLTAAPLFIATNATAAEHLAPCTHVGDEYYGLVEPVHRVGGGDPAVDPSRPCTG